MGLSIPLPPDLLRGKFIDCARRALSDDAANRLRGFDCADDAGNHSANSSAGRGDNSTDRVGGRLCATPTRCCQPAGGVVRCAGNRSVTRERTLGSLARLMMACLLTLCCGSGGAYAQKQGGVLKVTHRDNPPSASILEEATISTVMSSMAVCVQ